MQIYIYIYIYKGVAKSDTTRKPDTTNSFINRSWVEIDEAEIFSQVNSSR